jgi:hypothetical protein
MPGLIAEECQQRQQQVQHRLCIAEYQLVVSNTNEASHIRDGLLSLDV